MPTLGLASGCSDCFWKLVSRSPLSLPSALVFHAIRVNLFRREFLACLLACANPLCS
jgi:hypothetical protein